MPRKSFALSLSLVAASVGVGGAVFLDSASLGRTYPLHASRPGPALNLRAVRDGSRVEWRADLPSGAAHVVAPVTSAGALIRVDVVGPLEQRAGYHDPCSGWSDGHDAVADRLCEAFAQGDVLLVMDTPGGAAAGLAQGIERAQQAKAHHGRNCIVYADEQIGSAGVAWAYGIGDEVYIPKHGQIGSIGARGGHQSIAAMLAREGIEVTFFAWPNEGKIALAQERPLSDVGRERGARDISILGEWFAAMVESSAIGMRHGLTRDVIVALGADVLTGQSAVDGGLADGVASFDTVTSYALRLAESGRDGETAMPGARAEGDMPEDDKPKERAEEGKPEEQKCSSCNAARTGVGGYCAGCGKPFAKDDDEAPPSSKPPAKDKPEERASARAPTRSGTTLSLAPLLGIDETMSVPAQRQMAIDMRAIVSGATKLTGEMSADRVLAGFDVIGREAANARRYRSERNSAISERDEAVKHGLADRLLACNSDSYTRADVFVDEVDDKGARTGVKLATEFAEMSVARMRAIVERTEAKATKRDPFQPPTIDGAKANADAATGAKPGAITEEAITRATSLDAVKQIVNATGRDPRAVAKMYLETAAQNAAGGGR